MVKMSVAVNVVIRNIIEKNISQRWSGRGEQAGACRRFDTAGLDQRKICTFRSQNVPGTLGDVFICVPSAGTLSQIFHV